MSNIVILPTEEIKEALKGQDLEDLIAQPITVIFGGVHINYQISSMEFETDACSDSHQRSPINNDLDRFPQAEGRVFTSISIELKPRSQQVVEVRK